jgi:hypothetical protein
MRDQSGKHSLLPGFSLIPGTGQIPPPLLHGLEYDPLSCWKSLKVSP